MILPQSLVFPDRKKETLFQRASLRDQSLAEPVTAESVAVVLFFCFCGLLDTSFGFTLGFVAEVFFDTSRFAGQVTKVVKLAASYRASADALDFGNIR